MKRAFALTCSAAGLFAQFGCHGPSSQAMSEPRRLKLSALDDQDLKCGMKAHFTVHVEKESCGDATIAIHVGNLPRGVRVEEVSRKVDDRDMYVKYLIYADVDADLVSNYASTVTAESLDGMQAQIQLRVNVRKGDSR